MEKKKSFAESVVLFYEYIKKNDIISLDNILNDLKIPKRRIYELFNIFEGKNHY